MRCDYVRVRVCRSGDRRDYQAGAFMKPMNFPSRKLARQLRANLGPNDHARDDLLIAARAVRTKIKRHAKGKP